MLKKILIAGSCAVLLTAVSMTPAAQAEDGRNAALIAGVALGVLGAAIATDQHENGHIEYMPHPHVSHEENEVGRCVHRARRALANRGHHHAQFDHVVNYREERHKDRVVVQMAVHNHGHHHHHHTTYKNATCFFKEGHIHAFHLRPA